MSDSESERVPPDATIARALRDIVIAIHKSGNTDDLTVKRVRARTEEKLGLSTGFLKSEDWKQRSDHLIREAVEKYCDDEPLPKSKATPPKKPPKAKQGPQKKAKVTSDSTRGVKRKAAPSVKKPQKRRKAAPSDEESESIPSDSPEDHLSEAENEPPKKLARRQKKVVLEESDEEDIPKTANIVGGEDSIEGHSVATPLAKGSKTKHEKTPPPEAKGNASDSDLSSLIDESPVKKKRQKKLPSEKVHKIKETKTVKAKATKSKVEDDPDLAEIKRLQGWLVKCGIRKVWGKELAKCDTAKEKINHLKAMLRDAGMEGKFSNEKAAQIKEKREFAKDLEEIQAGALAWGQGEDINSGRPRRRANRPAPQPVILDDDEDEDEAQVNDSGVTDDDVEDDVAKDESEDDEDDE